MPFDMNGNWAAPAQSVAQNTPPQSQVSGMPITPPPQNYGQPMQPMLGGPPPSFGNAVSSFQGQPQQQWQPPMPQQSVEQGVNSNNPQSVQNFMSALNRTGAGTNNNFQNGRFQQGQGPQAGFMGFQQNGVQQAQQNAVQAGGAYQGQLGYQGNMAQQGQYGQAQMPQAYGGQIQSGGTGGIGGTASQFQTPQPWSQPLNNAPNVAGTGYGNDSQGWNNYLFGGGTPQPGAQQQGGFYSSTGQGGPNGPNASPTNVVNGNAWNNVTSDVNAKTNIQHADKDLKEFLDALGIYSYEYKDKQYGEGSRISPMAQEIESSPLGKQAISVNKEGYKQVDYGKLKGVELASLAMLNQKCNELEKKLKSVIQTNMKKRK